MNFQKIDLGLLYKHKNFIFFFGNRNSSVEKLKIEFPSLQFSRLKQIHSDILVDAALPSETLIEGDSHFTHQTNQALLALSADCVPILIFDSGSKFIAAVHAGWKGVAQRLLPKTIQKLQSLGAKNKDLLIAIGPHVQFSSFNVDMDVKQKILASLSKPEAKHFIDISKEKSKVNLAAVLETQLEEFQLTAQYISNVDTLTNPEFHSFRRDQDQAGRQYSFVARISEA